MQIFPPVANRIAQASVPLGVLLLAALVFALNRFFLSSYFTDRNEPLAQEVPFSHQHHVAGLGLRCLYCHKSVEVSSFADLPPTHTCMTCHSQIWSESPMLAPVRASYAKDVPLKWQRVERLPDYVYFDHAIHVNKGVGCASCHGRVDEMPLTWKHATLFMNWCLDCHRNPGKNLRPRSEIYNLEWQPPENQRDLGREPMQEYGIDTRTLTNCDICHR